MKCNPPPVGAIAPWGNSGWALDLTPEAGAGAQLAEDVTESQAPLPCRLRGDGQTASLGPAAAGGSPTERLTAQVQLIDRRQSHTGPRDEDVCQCMRPDYGVQ